MKSDLTEWPIWCEILFQQILNDLSCFSPQRAIYIRLEQISSHSNSELYTYVLYSSSHLYFAQYFNFFFLFGFCFRSVESGNGWLGHDEIATPFGAKLFICHRCSNILR